MYGITETTVHVTYNPLSRPLFIYVRDTAAQRAEVKEFIRFFLSDGHGALSN